MAQVHLENTTFTGSSSTWMPSSALQGLTNPNALLVVTVILTSITLLATRLLTQSPILVPVSLSTSHQEPSPVPSPPYWTPFLGHISNLVFNRSYIPSLRTIYPQGIFQLNFFTTRHNIIFTPSLAAALLAQKPENATSEEVSKLLMGRVFGFPKDELKTKYDAGLAGIMGCYRFLLTEPHLSSMVAQTATRLKSTIANLVTGADSLVDQAPWERTSNTHMAVDTRTGEPVVEASLLPLIRDFAAHNANPAIMGSDFLAEYPSFFADLWTLDRGFLFLAAGLPRWLPIPILTRAHIARQKLLQSLTTFHEALEREWKGDEPPEPKWSGLEDVSALVRARAEVYRAHGWSLQARAACENALMWAANANSNALIFWMVNRIYADRALLEMAREEIAPFVGAVEPERQFAFAEPARLDVFDVEGLCVGCPLLKSCYIECLRLDTASWSLKVVKQDFVLQGREKGTRGWMMRAGEYAHAAHDLHNTDPKVFADPRIFKADRHIRQEEGGDSRTADLGSIRPYGGGVSMCKGRAFAFKECMMFTAGIIAMWDITPAEGGEWKMPRHRQATGVYGTGDDTRVWVSRRKLSKPDGADATPM